MTNEIIQLKSPDRHVALRIEDRREIPVDVVEGSFWLYFDYPSFKRVSRDRSADPKVISVLVSIVVRADLPGFADMRYADIQRAITTEGAKSDYGKISEGIDFEEFSVAYPTIGTVNKIYFTKDKTRIKACFEEILRSIGVTYRYKDELDVKIIFDKELSASRMNILEAVDHFIDAAVQERLKITQTTTPILSTTEEHLPALGKR